MVARIRSGTSIKGAVNYNEKKVSEGKAELIGAKWYHKAFQRLNFHEKVNRLQHLAELNTRTKTNCLHLSLNFDPSEKLSKEKLLQVAETYMKGIKFGDQPYLVYHHHDAAHQHIHIVSTNIDKEGRRISLHNIGRGDSEKIRKEIEVKFGLVKAGRKQERKLDPFPTVKLEKAKYGETETKRAITNLVNAVIEQYNFASLPEFNAVLQRFGITADRGKEGSRMFEQKGLQYFLLNESLQKTGVPIKASSIFGKPTLELLESKFESNRKAKRLFVKTAQEKISPALQAKTREAFTRHLAQQNIDVVFHLNDQNFIYGVTYVDHVAKVVFNGSELGKAFSAAALRSHWEEQKEQALQQSPDVRPVLKPEPAFTNDKSGDRSSVIDILIDPNPLYDYVPAHLRRKRRRKKGKKL